MDEQNKNVENSVDQVNEVEPQETPAVTPQPTTLTVEQKPAQEKKSAKNTTAIVLTSIAVAFVGVVIAILVVIGGNGSLGSIGHTHTFEEWEIIKEATCSSTGSKERYCACGEKQTSEISKLDHDYNNWTTTKEATCTSEGIKERVCDCGEIQTSTIKKLDHNYSSWNITKEATCISEGSKERVCECGKKETEIISTNNNHSEITVSGVAATCTNTGLTDGKKCSLCGKTTLAQTTISKKSHSLYDIITKPATSTSTGTKATKCYNCNYSSSTSYSAVALSSEEIYELAESCVGEIVIYNKSGTAIALGTVFVYSSDGKLLTNYHVIEGAYSAKVSLNNKQYTVSSVLAYDKDIDLAVLKINASNLYTPVIQTEGIKGGAKVYAVGSSEGYTLSFSTGVIASPSRTFDGVEYIQHEAAISHGNSGGPLFNEYGEVIGINTLTNIDGQNLNFAISCKEIDNLYFGTSLTMSQFYAKECDPFELIKNYVIENGTYDSSDGDYSLLLDTSYSSDYTSKYVTIITYNIADDELLFSLHIDGETSAGFWVDSNLSGSYAWMYIDDYNYKMSGTITARTYTDNTLLGYSYNNISYSSLRSSIRELSSSMVDYILSIVNLELYPKIGITVADIGFTSY